MPGPPGPPDTERLGSESAGQHNAQPGAAALQTSCRSLCRAAGLSECQDVVVFGITALPADPAKQTGRWAEGCRAGRAVPCHTALGVEWAAPGGGSGVRGGQGADGTLHGTRGTEGTWPELGVTAVTPAQLTRYPPAAGWPVGGHRWERGDGHPKGWVLPPLVGKCPLPPRSGECLSAR